MEIRKNRLIVFTVTNDLTYDQRMIRICSTLADNGHEVLLTGRKKRKSIEAGKYNFEVHRINCLFEKGFLFYAEFNIKLFFHFLKKRPFAICSIDLDTSLPASLYRKIRNTRTIFDSHEYFTELPEIIERPFIRKFWSRVGRMTVKGYDICYTVNISLSEILSNKYHKAFEVVRNVPEWRADSILESPTQKFILYQGVLNKGRGLENLIECVRQESSLKLKIAGEGDLSDQLHEVVKSNKLQSRVEFLGFIPPKDLSSLTRTSWIGINVLESKSKNYYYSLANKFFDYMHAGIPMICMDFPEYRKINDEFEVAVLIKEPDIKSIKMAIAKLENDEFYQKLRENCKKASMKYKWQTEKKSLLAIYESIDM